MEPWKGLPFSYPPPPASSHVARNLVYMCVDIPAHISKLHPYPLLKLPLDHPLGLWLRTLIVQFTLRGTELWGRDPYKFRGHVGMLFQNLGYLKFVLEDIHSSVWLCVHMVEGGPWGARGQWVLRVMPATAGGRMRILSQMKQNWEAPGVSKIQN